METMHIKGRLMIWRAARVAAVLLACSSLLAAAPLKIMPLGDSLTGVDPNNFPSTDPSDPIFHPLERYRLPLATLLHNGGYEFDYVGTMGFPTPNLADGDNEGHGGYRINWLEHGKGLDGTDGSGNPDGVAAWLDQLSAVNETPDIILLMIGTNNMWNSSDRNGAVSQLDSLLATLTAEAPHANIIVSSVPRTTFTAANDLKYNQFILDYNARIPGLVNTYADAGKKITFVDGFAAVTESDVRDDHIHLYQSGYDHLAGVWYQGIVSLPEPTMLGLLLTGSLPLLRRRR